MVRACYTGEINTFALSSLVLYLQVLVFLLCLAALGYYGFSLYATIAFFRSQPNELTEIFTPPVTILKPLCGLDWESYDCLASFCQQDYPEYQLIFTLQDPQDPSLAIVEKLQQDFPALNIEVVISDRHLGINPKINNLANGFNLARYDLFVISDSDIQVKNDYLKAIIQPFKEAEVGVVTCLYNSVTAGWLAGFEALDIATQFLPKVMTARQLEGMNFALGSTIAIRRETLDKIGGLVEIVNHLADDYQLGYLAKAQGYQVILSRYIVEHHLGNVTMESMISRQARWQKCIRIERFWGYVGLIFTQGTVLSSLFFALTQASVWGWIVFGILWLARYLTAYWIAIALFQDPTAKQFWLWTPLRDFLTFGIWCYSFIGDRVSWRGKTYQLLPNGQLSQL